MSKFVVLGALFFGVLLSINKVDASLDQANILKGLKTVPHNFFDPREEQSPDATNKGSVPDEDAELK